MQNPSPNIFYLFLFYFLFIYLLMFLFGQCINRNKQELTNSFVNVCNLHVSVFF